MPTTPVNPTAAEIAYDRMKRLTILTFSLKRQTDSFRHLLVPREPVTLRGAWLALKAQQRAWWTRELAKFR